jgi:hypothetical protein
MPILPVPFMGEKMTCVMCGKVEKSDPGISSQWRTIDIDASRYYACPDEFPADGSGADAFEAAYLVIFTKINQIIEWNRNNERKRSRRIL